MKSTGMRPFIGALCFTYVVSFGQSSSAATVEPGTGNLWINRGQGFKPVSAPVNSKAGDSIMVGPGGNATVVYDDGCKVPVQPSVVTTIAPLSPCAAGSNAQADNTDSTSVWGTAALGVGVAAVGGFIAYEATRHSSSPASP